MADLSSVVDNYFATPSETFTDNLSGSIAAGASIVPVNSAVEYATGEVAVITVDPGTANEATFLGEKDSTNQFINCFWTEGNLAVGHDAGATVIDYDSATHFAAMSKGIQQFANMDGTLKYDAVSEALGLGATSVNGWEVFPYAMQVASGYNVGNKSYSITVPNQDATSLLSSGQRLRVQRGTTPPTQCLDLESGTSQYASRTDGSVTGIIFTDDFTCEAWIKLESYGGGSDVGFVSRAGAGGWWFGHNSTGQVVINGANAGGANYRRIVSQQSLPIGRWVHVVGTLDMSGSTGNIYIDGVAVPAAFASGGTSPSSLNQVGNLQVGAIAGASFLDGKIADVRVWSALRTATEVQDNSNQQLVGSETNLVAYFKLAGDLTDSTSSANTLTGSGGAAATDVEHPFKSTEYGIITSVTYSAPNTVVTLFTGTDHSIPNMSLTALYYSSQRAPYGFPSSGNKWVVETIGRTASASTSVANNAIVNLGGLRLSVPTGAWEIDHTRSIHMSAASTYFRLGLSNTDSAFSDATGFQHILSSSKVNVPTGGTNGAATVNMSHIPALFLSTTFLYSVQFNGSGGARTVTLTDDEIIGLIRARCAYV